MSMIIPEQLGGYMWNIKPCNKYKLNTMLIIHIKIAILPNLDIDF